MKEYIKEIRIKGKEEDFFFSGIFFNEENEVEFKNTNLSIFKNKKIIYSKKHKGLLIFGFDKKVLLRLSSENISKLDEFEKKIKNEIILLYKNITTGNEPLICLDLENDEYPYLITTKTILNNGQYSPKYIMALKYAFSNENLKKANIKIYPNFKNYTDMQIRLNESIKKLKLTPNYNYKGTKAIKTTLKEVLKGVA